MSNKKKIILMLIIICIIIMSITYGCSVMYKKYNPKLPDGESETTNEKSSGAGSVSIEYSNYVEIDSDNKKVNIYFKNPVESKEKIKLELLVDNQVIAVSKKIEPGEEIKALTLKKEINKGNYKGIFKLKYYEVETEKEHIVDSVINVNIKVK